MPIYEYRCAACGYQKEYLQKVSDPLLTDCPDCGKSTLGKLVTAAGFQLKGSGWYATDFRNNGARPKADKEKGEAAEPKKGETAEPKKGETAKPKKDDKSEPASGTGAVPACT
jgi:putative FmdB family regulatory protein